MFESEALTQDVPDTPDVTVRMEVIPLDVYAKNFALELESSENLRGPKLNALIEQDLQAERARALRKIDSNYRATVAARHRLFEAGMGGIYRGVWVQHAFVRNCVWVPALGRSAYYDLSQPRQRERLDAAIDHLLTRYKEGAQ